MADHPTPRDAVIRLLVLLTLAALLILPFLAFGLSAFSERWFYPQVIPDTWSTAAWGRVLGPRSSVPDALLNSAGIALAVTGISLIVGLPAARALGLYSFRGKRLVELLVLLPTTVPPLAVGMGLSVNFLRIGLNGTYVGIALAHLVPALPYVVLTLSGVFANYDVEYEEQARSLGARPWAIWWHVTFPAVFPGIIVAGLFAFLISWSQYVLTLLVGDGRIITMPTLLFSSATGASNAEIAAHALLFVGPTLLILLLTSRYLGGSRATLPV